MQHSKKLEEFIKAYETLHDGDLTKIGLQPKLCPANVWTEGWGETLIGPDGKMLRYSEKYKTIDDVLPFSNIYTECEANVALTLSLRRRGRQVAGWLKVPVSQQQFDALLSHFYNCGKSETLYRLVNNRAPEADIKNWFTTKYVTSGGVFMRGLQFRRNDEYEMWAFGDYQRDNRIKI